MNRKIIFYNSTYNRRPGFSNNSIISCLININDKTNTNRLLQTILHYNKRKIPKRIKSIIKMLFSVGLKHKTCPYGYILNKNCPLRIKTTNILYNNTIKYESVFNFVKEIIDYLFTFKFWGSKHNYKIICKYINIIISSNKNDIIDLKYVYQYNLDNEWN